MFAKHFQISGPGSVGHDLDLGTLIVVGTHVVSIGYSDTCLTHTLSCCLVLMLSRYIDTCSCLILKFSRYSDCWLILKFARYSNSCLILMLARYSNSI